VKEVLPEAVSQDDEGYLSIAYGEIVPVLIEAMKEQQETIEDQQQTIEELRTEKQEMQQALQEIDKRVTELEQQLEQQPA
jgi:peptidoglycan hydrolase CwlO-like protein